MHVQSVQKYYLSLSNVQICGVLVAGVVLVTYAPHHLIVQEDGFKITKIGFKQFKKPNYRKAIATLKF